MWTNANWATADVQACVWRASTFDMVWTSIAARWWGATFARSNCNRANTSSRPASCGLQRGKAQWAGPRRWADCLDDLWVMPWVFIQQGGTTWLMVEANAGFSMTKFTIPGLKVFGRVVFDLVLLDGLKTWIGFVAWCWSLLQANHS